MSPPIRPSSVPLQGGSAWVDAARSIHAAGVEAAMPGRLLETWDWDGYGPRVRWIAVGKAAIPFTLSAEEALGSRYRHGVAVVPHGYALHRPLGMGLPSRTPVLEAGHPVPDSTGLRAVRRVMEMADEASEGETLVVAVSGGGSALLPALPPGFPIGAWARTTDLLLASGASIGEINTVRRSLSLLAGGRLAARGRPATIVGLYLSDVPGDDPATIAGGLTVTSPTTAGDAGAVLEAYGLVTRVPTLVLDLLDRGGVPVPLPVPVENHVVGTVADALTGAADAARRSGFEPVVIDARMEGEARDVAVDVVREMIAAGGATPRCLLWGGETTVTVRGDGRGGRNQELALAAAIELSGRCDGLVLAAGTDGRDGPTDAAGAWVTAGTVEAGRACGISARDALERNDSGGFFEAVGGRYVTGPTHTNVTDLVVALVGSMPGRS